MTINDDIACLETVPTFSILGPNALRILAIGCETRTLAPGEVLFKAGDPADCGYVVRDGLFRLEPVRRGQGDHAEQAHDADESAPITIGPGGLLGELALIIATTRPVTAIAEEPAVVMRISRHLFSKTLEGFPDAAVRLRDHMIQRALETAAAFSQVRAQLGVYDAVAGDFVPEIAPQEFLGDDEE